MLSPNLLGTKAEHGIGLGGSRVSCADRLRSESKLAFNGPSVKQVSELGVEWQSYSKSNFRIGVIPQLKGLRPDRLLWLLLGKNG